MLYILHGPDDFIRAEKIAELKATMGDPSMVDLNITRLEGHNLTLSDIRRNTDTIPFLAARRLVIVKNHLKYLAGKVKQTKILLDYLPHLPQSTDLVFVETEQVDKKHAVMKEAIKNGQVQFAGLDAKNLQLWIVKRVKELGGNIEPRAANLLGKVVGLNLLLLNTEIEKLTIYVNAKRPIRVDDIYLLTPYTEDAQRFGLSNAIGLRNARQAYDQLQKELDEGKNPMAILGGIAAQIRALIEVKDMAGHGMTVADIAREKGWKSNFAAKARLKEASRFSMSRLEQIMEMLLKTDLAIKTGRMDSKFALDILIANLCVVT